MARFKIFIDPEALQDIQDATDWYNNELSGLGSRFQKQVKNTNQFIKEKCGGVRCSL